MTHSTAEALASLCKARVESDVRGRLQLCHYDNDAAIQQHFRVVNSGTYSMLVWRDSGEEVVLDVQGLIGECLLPPLARHVG